MYFWDDAHEASYTRFRFKHRDLYKNYSEKTIREIFDDVYFLMEMVDGDHLCRWDVLDHVDNCMEKRGIQMPFVEDLVYPIMGFIFRERGFTGIKYEDLRNDVFDLVFETSFKYIDDTYRFSQILTDRLIEEYKTGDRTIPMNEVANNLRRYPELAFLPFGFLEDAAFLAYALLLDNEI